MKRSAYKLSDPEKTSSAMSPKRKVWINLWIHRDGSPISDAYSNKRKADRDAQDTDACTFNQQIEIEVDA